MTESLYFLRGGGEMGSLMREFDWSKTSLGTPERWPVILANTVSTILSSKFPMFLWWGEEMIQFYNDAYRPSLGNDGKHPGALGQKGKECWPEIWDIIYPLIEQVRTTGEATWSEDQLVPIYRNGRLENVYWTFGYSPIWDVEKISGVLVVCTETTEKVNNLRALYESKKELEFAIEATELGAWDLNPATNRFSANARLKDWFGLQPEEEIALPLALNIIVEEDRQRVTEAIHWSLQYESGGLYDIEYTIVHPDTGYRRCVRARGKALFNENKVCIRFNGTLQDITVQRRARERIEEEVRERTKELAAANAELLSSNASLAQFAYIASHDLQEPLRKISLYAQLLESSLNEGVTERSNNYIQKIITSVGRMLLLTRDVLAYSQITDAGQSSFELTDVTEVIKDVTADLELLIEQKGATIQYGPLPVLEAIPLQLSQLCGNLITNALKFARPDIAPVISVTASPLIDSSIKQQFLLADEPYVEIVFKDNGIGFEQDLSEKIFNVFQRLHSKAQFEGTGIGLAICKKIVLRHRGNIYALSEPGKGAAFHVLLPLRQPQPG